MANSNLHAAKSAKNDEFYTQLKDIENEIRHYREYFRGKKVFLNCDDPEWSNFWKFFELNFEFLGLKKLTAVHFEESKPSYKLELEHDINGDGKVNGKDIVKTDLEQNGDFRSPESIAILKESDIVVTNPPFSLFRELMDILQQYEKDFLIIGNMNAITYKNCFNFIKSNKLWLGVTSPKQYILPDGSLSKKFGNHCWFTNLDHSIRNETMPLASTISGNDYPTYDNYNAIEVSKVSNIPVDCKGEMGVPITFLTKYNPSQFEIVRFRKGNDDKDLKYTINGKIKQPYFRIIIKWKK